MCHFIPCICRTCEAYADLDVGAAARPWLLMSMSLASSDDSLLSSLVFRRLVAAAVLLALPTARFVAG